VYPKPVPAATLFSYVVPYYISIFTYKNQDVFNNKCTCELLLNVLTYNKYSLDYRVYGFVIMPDHLHIIFQPCKVPISQVVRKNAANFTRYYQKITGMYIPIWNMDYYELKVKDYPTLKKIQEHIHSNPMRSSLVNDMGEYFYSSYRFYERDNDDFMMLLDRLRC